MNPEMQHRIEGWKAKILRDGSLPPEELKAAIIALREARRAAVPTATKVKKAAPNADALLSELGL